MADAIERRKVLFLTPSRLVTNGIVERAKTLVAAILGQEVMAYFADGTSPWHVRVKEAGWVFFFPQDEISPTEDVGNPDRVYLPKTATSYMWIPYAEWRHQSAKPKGPRSMWERLRDDD